MRPLDEKEIQEKFGKLPQVLKDAAQSEATLLVIKEIADASLFNEQARIELENKTLAVILGLIHPKDFIREIRKIDGIEYTSHAVAIAQEINRRIFRPVRDELRKLHGIDDVAAIQETVPEDSRMNLEGEAPGAIHSTIATPAPSLPAVPPAVPPPRFKPLDAELSEGVGLRPPAPPSPPSSRKPLDAELAESFRRPPHPQPP